jgi:hypothetical protein
LPTANMKTPLLSFYSSMTLKNSRLLNLWIFQVAKLKLSPLI